MRKAKGTDLKTHVLKQILESAQNQVWTASDFAALGGRAALDKVLQRLVATRMLAQELPEGFPLVGGGIIQQHNDRAAQVP
jgi:hypothetical protein